MTIPITVVAFQTVTPVKMTPPKRFRRIIASASLPEALLRGHFRLVLYYRSSDIEGSALAAAAWIKDSLSVALTEEPILAGRLRRSEAAGIRWELKFNDAGVRLVQASAAVELAEILDADDRKEREWGLVYWKDVEKENTDQSALFYIQVTDFQGSGYSIGISCSLLLSDPLFLIRFLVKWSHIHRRMITATTLAVDSLFHLSRFSISPLPAHLAATPMVAPLASTALFRLPSAARPAVAFTGASSEAAGSLLIHSDHAGDLTVELCDGNKLGGEGHDNRVDVQWEGLAAAELVLGEGGVPVDASYRIVPGGNEGMAMVMEPGGGSDILVSMTVPIPAKC